MELILWEKKFATGNEKLDQEHREFAQMVNRLHQAFEEGTEHASVQATAADLHRHLMTHLEEEEELMRRSGYPGLDSHVREHKRFAERLDALKTEVAYKYRTAPVHAIRFMAEWWIDHIRTADKEFGAYLAGRSG